MARPAFALLSLQLLLAACPGVGAGKTNAAPKNGIRPLEDFVPGGECPAGMPRSPHTERPAAVGPASGQEVIVLSLPKMGSTTMAWALAQLGYVSAHDMGDALGCEGINAISNACELQFQHLDEKHPGATWIILYDNTFETWLRSAVKWLWLRGCRKGYCETRALSSLFSKFVDEAAAAFGSELTTTKEDYKRLFYQPARKICRSQEARSDASLLQRQVDGLLGNSTLVAGLRQRYEVYMAAVHCYFEPKPHLSMDMRAEPEPYAMMAPWLRNGSLPIDASQVIPHANQRDAPVHGRALASPLSVQTLHMCRTQEC